MKTIATDIHVDATPDEVWKVLVDFPQLSGWSPFFASIEGELARDAKLTVTFRKPRITMRPRVTALEPGHHLEWLGRMGIRGIFDGRHRFEVTAEEGGTRFRQSEQFSGFLVPLLGRMLAATEKNFAAFNQALKVEVERRQAA